jgi:AcrR family transcriptional regulator
VAFSPKRALRTNEERVHESTVGLLDAAIRLFAEQGYERTTAAEIGLRAGFSRNMVRDRYGTKEALLESLFDTQFGQRLLPAMRRERIGTGLQRVLGQLDDLLGAVQQEPEIIRAMIVLTFETPAALSSFAPWFDDLINGYQSELAGHFAAGQRDGSVRDDLDPDREAEVFVSYAIGLCFRSVLVREGYDFAAQISAWRSRLEAHCAVPVGHQP